ncbi:MAG: MFS transporter [Alphaproteobacteria bacterium]|nr:MFS transporter [Alphaproteobacteria bacterium]
MNHQDSVDRATSATLSERRGYNDVPGLRMKRITAMLWTMIVLAVLSQFYRSSNGVIAPQIMDEMNVDAAAIGLSSGAFFLIFAALQVPIGVLFDKYGARLVVSSMLVFSIAGSILFAVAHSVEALVAGRFLIGLGLAGGMVGSLVILARWHTPSDFTRAMTILFATANLGSLLATSPLAASAEWIGWRSTFLALAFLTTLVGIAFYAVVRDRPDASEPDDGTRESLGAKFRGVGQVFQVRGLLWVLPMVALGYSSVITILGLWGAPYLTDVHGLDSLDGGTLLSVLAVAFVAGTLAFGPIQRRCSGFRRVVIASATVTGLLLLALTVFIEASLVITVTLLILICFVGAFSVVLMGHGISLIPKDLVGRGTTTLNCVLMGGAAILQIASGALVETVQVWFGSPTAGYAAFFGALGVLMLAATLLYMRAPEPPATSDRP